MRCGSGVKVVMLVTLIASSSAAFAEDLEPLARAQKLAWSRHFAEAEQIYREILKQSPHSRGAALGLARVLLWEGRYRDARERFLNLGDREGAATAAYWQGDFRTASREFRKLADRALARESLAAIEQASRGSDRIDSDWLHDDQPFRTLRSAATSSFFSDPLTRWDVTAGGSALSAPRLQARRQLAFASVTNETVMPWQRLTLSTSAGLQRYPDGSSRPVGGVAIRFRTSPASSITATIDHRDLLTNATALQTHPSETRSVLAWTRYAARGWLAGFEIGSLRYFDHNRGRYTQGYALMPIRGAFIGASAAFRDTTENRFDVEAVSASRLPAGGFEYAYRGSYTPYWTPQHLREVRAIALVTGRVKALEWRVQMEAGIARDRVTGFGPLTGAASLPTNIFTFEFTRTSHPARGAISLAVPLRPHYRLEWNFEHNTTAFYAANAIHASLVRQR